MMKKINGHWVDGNNNKWDAKKFTKEEATKCSKTLKNCSLCVNCRNCQECIGCNNYKDGNGDIGCDDSGVDDHIRL